MGNKAVISLTTGLEDPERVTVALLVGIGAAEQGRPTLAFLAKEAVRLAVSDMAVGTACDGCPSLPELMDRYERAGGRFLVCPICFQAKKSGRRRRMREGERGRAPTAAAGRSTSWPRRGAGDGVGRG